MDFSDLGDQTMCGLHAAFSLYLGQEVKNKLNPSFEVLLFRGHGLGSLFDGAERGPARVLGSIYVVHTAKRIFSFCRHAAQGAELEMRSAWCAPRRWHTLC